jgi:hypothetical protein
MESPGALIIPDVELLGAIAPCVFGRGRGPDVELNRNRPDGVQPISMCRLNRIFVMKNVDVIRSDHDREIQIW